jgi:serine/threonine protein kinase
MQKIVSAVSNQIQQFANPTVTKRYKLEGTIGKGNFSQVKRATDRQTGQEVAVKILSLATLKDKEKVLVNYIRSSAIYLMAALPGPHTNR